MRWMFFLIGDENECGRGITHLWEGVYRDSEKNR